jgi:hypothetical protein
MTVLPPRFTLMRSRHASDSQLSTRSKQHDSSKDDDTPPLPSVPPSMFRFRSLLSWLRRD